jgi:hypothetical protein
MWQSKEFDADTLASIHSSVREVNSELDSTHRNIGSLMIKRLANLLQRSEHTIISGLKDHHDFVAKTEWIDPKKWDERVELTRKSQAAINNDEKAAKQVIGKMVADELEFSGGSGRPPHSQELADGDIEGQASASHE